MSKRLQVLLEEAEMREIRRAARRSRITLAEWVRRSLRDARGQEPLRDAGRKLEIVRGATQHAFPPSDLKHMLAEIERGYLGAASR